MPYEVAVEVGRLRRLIAKAIASGRGFDEILERAKPVKLPLNALEDVARNLEYFLKRGVKVPSDKHVLVEVGGGYAVIHCCFGNLVNRALAKLISILLTAELGVRVNVKVDAYRILVIFPTATPHNAIKTVLERIKEMKGEDVKELVKAALRNSPELMWRFVNVAKRFGLLEKKASLSRREVEKLMSSFRLTPVYEEALREVLLEDIDLENLTRIVDRVKKGEISVTFLYHSSLEGFSPLAKECLELYGNLPAKTTAQEPTILKTFEERLRNTLVRLVCICCGWSTLKYVKSLEGSVKCGSCGSRLVGIVRPEEGKVVKVVKKVMQRRRLTKEEKKIWDTLKLAASLLASYGYDAALAFATRGVGVKTAARILSTPYMTRDDLLKRLIEAEKQYLRTKPYWGG